MLRARVAKILWVLALTLPLTACKTPQPAEPEADYTVLRPLLYDYALVFDCATETFLDEGFQVAKGDRDSGVIDTGFVPGTEDHVKGRQEGRRLRALVVKNGPRDFSVKMAATRVERKISKDDPGPWIYVGPDVPLMEKLKKRFDKNVEKRYKPAPEKG